MKHYIILYLATFAVMGVVDMVWLNVIASDFYKKHMGELLEFHLCGGYCDIRQWQRGCQLAAICVALRCFIWVFCLCNV